MKFVCLFITVTSELLSLTMAEYQWSGFVNIIKQNFDFLCEDNLAATGVASEFKCVHTLLLMQQSIHWNACTNVYF